MSRQRIYYFDNNATTRVAPEVLDAMLPFLRDHYGNPSSVYKFGSQTGHEIKKARAKVAALLNAAPGKSSSPVAARKATTRPFTARWPPIPANATS